MPASSAPREGAVTMRQTGRADTSAAANGITSRIARQRLREASSLHTSTAPNVFTEAISAALRWSTEGPTPSSRNAVSERPVTVPGPMRDATAGDRWAAPETSQEVAIAAAMARTAAASSRPDTTTVACVCGRGRVLMVTVVRAASVPQEPAMSLLTS